MKKKINSLTQSLQHAGSFQEWRDIAYELDHLTGRLAWRETYSNSDTTFQLFKEHTERARALIELQNWEELAHFIKESLYQTIGELSNDRLYNGALSGPKKWVEAYLNCMVEGINKICDTDIPGISDQDKLTRFNLAKRNLGRTALMLSGGGTFGIYHLGVAKALFEAHLLPTAISGSSMGAIIAAVLATYPSEALSEVLQNPQEYHFRPLKRLAVKESISQQSLLDPQQLLECISSNVGDVTFAEAFQRTGREVSITVSPARRGQKPQILNYQTAPEALVNYAARASCSIPGLFPAAQLMAKDTHNNTTPYLEQERWVDGSFAGDVPRQRISRLHNINYFIVSQANPHVLPFVMPRQKSGLYPFLQDLTVSSMLAQSHTVIKSINRHINRQPWRSWLDHASLFIGQDYLGDINIHPHFPKRWFFNFMKNPSEKEISYLIKTGERATWPLLSRIDAQTVVRKTLKNCIIRLEKRI